MMNKYVFLASLAVLTLCVILPGETLFGQNELPGLSIYQPTYFAWKSYSGKVYVYDSTTVLIPEKNSTEAFVNGGDSPESAASLYWGATSKSEVLAVSTAEDSLIVIPDFKGRAEFYKYNPGYQLISKILLTSKGGDYAYLHYNLYSDILKEGVEGVIVLQLVDNRWFHFAGDPVSGFALAVISIQPNQLQSMFRGGFNTDPRFEHYYTDSSEGRILNVTKLINGFKTWYLEDGQIKDAYLDILRYPNWKQ